MCEKNEKNEAVNVFMFIWENDALENIAIIKQTFSPWSQFSSYV